MLFKLSDGTVYDPQNGINGEVRDLWMRDGSIIDAPLNGERPDQELDVRGYVVMPGGIDMHCHIAGPKVNVGRKMIPEMKRGGPVIKRTSITRSGTIGPVPSTFATGYLYSQMGYTTAFDAAIPGLLARHAHEEFADTPQLDKGFFVLFGNNHYVMDRIREADREQLDAYCSWMLESVKGYTIKIVNPGGVESWKQICRMSMQQLDEPVPHFNVTPRAIVRELAAASDRLKLPHSVHIHCNNLGIPGNWRTTQHTMESLEGHRGHFAHVQFHSYAGDPNDPLSFRSATPQLIDYVRQHPEITVDVGHVNPGKTLSHFSSRNKHMPHYEYHCPANGQTIEVYHGMSERLQTWGELCSKAESDLGATPASSPIERIISGGLAMPSSKGSSAPEPLPMAKSCGVGCGCH